MQQENQLVSELSVTENIYLYDLPKNRGGLLDYAGCRKAASALMGELGIGVPAARKISALTFIEKKLVSIAKACSRKAKVLILDEPTASLDEKGKKVLFDIIRQGTRRGLRVIYISRNLGEIFEIADRVTVFKDGRKVATHRVAEITEGSVIQEMIGRSSTSLHSRQPAALADGEKLEVLDYSRAGVVEHVSFQVHRGEIFGIAGLVGAGRPVVFPVAIPFFLGMMVIAFIVLKYFRYGRFPYAIGGKKKAAYVSGINTNRVTLTAFIVVGLCNALAALILISRVDSALATTGDSYALDALASVIVGGASIAGGKGTALNVFLGVMLIGLISNSLIIMNVNPYVRDVVIGFIIIAAVTISQLTGERE